VTLPPLVEPAESLTVDEVRRYSPHEQQDDITLVVAKCRPGEPEAQMGLPYDSNA